MKILLLNYEFPPMGGGAGNATYNIARELAQLGHHVDVVTSKLRWEQHVEEVEGFTVYRVRSWRRGIHDCGFIGALNYVCCAVWTFLKLTQKNNYDVIHYFFGLPTGLLSLLPGAHRRIPYIVSLRGSDVPMYDIYNKRLQFFHSLCKPLTRFIWKRAKKVVALSTSLKSTALKVVPCQEISIIPNGIEIDLFTPSNDTWERSIFKLITVSRLIERKGIQYILQAMAQLKNEPITLLIVGSGNYENQLKALSHELGLDSIVGFFGACFRDRLPALYRQHDVFILTSLAESYGIVFSEAMACGLPIIAARTGGIPDLVKNDNGILVDPEDVEGITQAILAMKNNKAMRTMMGKRNRERVLEYCNWGKVTEQYLQCYRNK